MCSEGTELNVPCRLLRGVPNLLRRCQRAADLDVHAEQFRHRFVGEAGPFICVVADPSTMTGREGRRVCLPISIRCRFGPRPLMVPAAMVRRISAWPSLAPDGTGLGARPAAAEGVGIHQHSWKEHSDDLLDLG